MRNSYLTLALDGGELRAGAALSPVEELLELIRKESKKAQETVFTL